MEVKLFEVRDRATCMPVMVTKLQHPNPIGRQAAVLSRAGFATMGPPICYLFTILHNGKTHWDAHNWADRTTSNAHKFIENHFDELEDGEVIDVEFILGEKPQPSESEINRFTQPFN